MNFIKLLSLLVLAVPAFAQGDNLTNLGERSTCEHSTAFKNPADGIVAVDFICATSTNPVGGYVALYDEASTSGIVLAPGAANDYVVSVSAKILSGTVDCAKPSCEFFNPPLPLRAGVVFGNSHADMRSSVGYRVLRRN